MEYHVVEEKVGKFHMNIQENDILIHCTDNPGRITFIRTSIQQKKKVEGELTDDEAYEQCLNDFIMICKVDSEKASLISRMNTLTTCLLKW